MKTTKTAEESMSKIDEIVKDYFDTQMTKILVLARAQKARIVEQEKKLKYFDELVEECEEVIDVMHAQIPKPCALNPAEAVYGFAAWLTTRQEKSVMSATDDSGVIANLVAEFCRVNNLPNVSTNWPDNLKHPLAEKPTKI